MASSSGLRRHGLYYPFFHIRDEQWLKVAALYWPRLARIAPDGCPTRDSDAVKMLIEELDFVARQSPGASIQAVAPTFLDLLDCATPELDGLLRFVPAETSGEATVLPRLPRHLASEPVIASVRVNQIDSGLVDGLIERGWARRVRSPADTRWAAAESEAAREAGYDDHLGGWIAMRTALTNAYTTVLAEHVASVNRLQLTTDQPPAFAMSNSWSAKVIAAALVAEDSRAAPTAEGTAGGELGQILGVLALNLVVPHPLDDVPMMKIIEVRRRYGAEFLAFRQAVDEAANDLAELADIRDATFSNGISRPRSPHVSSGPSRTSAVRCVGWGSTRRPRRSTSKLTCLRASAWSARQRLQAIR